MEHLSHWIGDYGLWFVFFSVLVTQLGLPVPAYPTLVLAAALLVPHVHSFPLILAVATVATLLADIGWYVAGYRLGHRMLSKLCKVSLSPDSCVRQTESIYHRFGAPSLMVAKFIPGFAAVATAMAGTLQTPLWAFIAFDTIGGLLWAGVALALGVVFRDAIGHAFEILNALGQIGVGVILACFILFAGVKWAERRRLYRTLRMARITVRELHDLIEQGHDPIIFDVRSVSAQRLGGRIPGAVAVNEKQLATQLDGLPRLNEVVVYCACPSEASAARIAKLIMQHGFKQVRPLEGGIDEWIDQGYPIESDVAEVILRASEPLQASTQA